MTSRKALSLITAAAVLAGSVIGCSLLGGKDKTAAGEAVTNYIEAISKAKYGTSKKYVIDEEDYFLEHEFDGATSGILEALWSATEYELGDIEVNKDSATVEVEFTMPDLESIADEGYSYNEFVDAIADIDDMTEETFEFELSKEDDEWLIEPDSTHDFFTFFIDLTADLDFAGLSEEAAMEAVSTFISYMAEGDLASAEAMNANAVGYDPVYDDGDAYDELMGNLMAAYFSNLDYELEVTEVTDDSITVAVTGMAPDAYSAVNAAANDPDIMAPITADYIEATVYGICSNDNLEADVFAIVADAIDTADLIPYSSFAVVTADEDGNLFVRPDSSFVQTFDFPEYMNEAIVPAALDLLYEQGRITAEQYDELSATFYGSVSGSGYAYSSVVVVEGDDYYDHNVIIDDQFVRVQVQTWMYYNEGDTFSYFYVTDDDTIISGDYVMHDNNSDIIEIVIPVGDSGPYGDYAVTVYDEGSNVSSVLVTLEIAVHDEGAPADTFGTGESMTFTEASDDVYVFHFIDESGDWIEEGTLSSDSDAIYFFTRTWGYYEDGDSMDCDVYLDGEYVDTLTYVLNGGDGLQDTFEFEYAPASGLESGDYTFVMHDVNAESVFVVAYATVED